MQGYPYHQGEPPADYTLATSKSGRKVLRGTVVKVLSPFPTIPKLALWQETEVRDGKLTPRSQMKI